VLQSLKGVITHDFGVVWNIQHPLGAAVTHFAMKECSHNTSIFFCFTRGVASAPEFNSAIQDI